MTRAQFDSIIRALTPDTGEGFFVEVDLVTGASYQGALCATSETNRGSLLTLELDIDREHNQEHEAGIRQYIDLEHVIAVRGPIL